MSVKFCNWCPTPYSPDLKAHPNGTPAHQQSKETAMTDFMPLIAEARKALTEAASETTGTAEQVAHYRDLADQLRRFESEVAAVMAVYENDNPLEAMFALAPPLGEERRARLREVLRSETDADPIDGS